MEFTENTRNVIAPDGLDELTAALLTVRNRLSRFYPAAYEAVESDILEAERLLEFAKQSRFVH